MKRTKLVSSPDDWYPSIEGKYVEVTIHKDAKASLRVTVFGADDFGLELSDLTLTEALLTFRKIKDGITQTYLKSLGFTQF